MRFHRYAVCSLSEAPLYNKLTNPDVTNELPSLSQETVIGALMKCQESAGLLCGNNLTQVQLKGSFRI